MGSHSLLHGIFQTWKKVDQWKKKLQEFFFDLRSGTARDGHLFNVRSVGFSVGLDVGSERAKDDLKGLA